ncbi:Uncharacterised protein [Burkholderia pseudomallei]|uniref:hypothetical protein n=1 Tax=Burkholderia pseudomallei TaxID=28450 RepID=UPI0006883EF0|nr:hypothetical protein [Burkholderia pseudomallei]ARL49457.1 hypothetical protein BOC51_05150 [Burkholderia pseudomallei]MBF3557425.1 hypothetical protein [Burkholderia pseudomallei]MDY7816305.1 hypothetical protein [Burkholderia pseudomallei]MDY7863034.1 hypothetical protein [Burkholderia pseudomallei]OND90597.1 hypothetical protein AQ941_27755 [Burkholderia pseudomallei]
MTTSYTWWEKTVEYAFILQTRGLLDFAAPLAGRHEGGGDGIFASDSKLLLIEFKRNYSTLSSERPKFADFDSATASLSEHDAHHFVVYGHEVVRQHSKAAELGLAAQTYFSEKPAESFEKMFAAGVSIDDFNLYLNALLELKVPDGRTSGSIGSASYASVFGVSATQGAITVSMEEYLAYEMKYEHNLDAPQSTYDFSPPGM